MRTYTHEHIHVCSLVCMSWLIVFLLKRLWNVFKKKLILVHRISAESTKKPVCKQRSDYDAPTRDVSFMACTIDKQLFLRNFPFIIHTHKFYQAILVVLRYLSTCCSDSGLTHMQILMNLIHLSRTSLVICFKNWKSQWLNLNTATPPMSTISSPTL